VAIGGYAYDWHGGETADELSFQEAAVAARDSSARVDFDPDTNNPHFSYIENDNIRHDVWFLDAVTAYNQIHAADIFQPAGYALWRLGSEDPSVWSVLGRGYGAGAPAGLGQIPTNENVDFEGEGEVLRVEANPSPGARTFEVDAQTGDISDETYTSLPTSYVIRRVGAVPHELSLTFDDGPDPAYTPDILDILKERTSRRRSSSSAPMRRLIRGWSSASSMKARDRPITPSPTPIFPKPLPRPTGSSSTRRSACSRR